MGKHSTCCAMLLVAILTGFAGQTVSAVELSGGAVLLSVSGNAQIGTTSVMDTAASDESTQEPATDYVDVRLNAFAGVMLGRRLWIGSDIVLAYRSVNTSQGASFDGTRDVTFGARPTIGVFVGQRDTKLSSSVGLLILQANEIEERSGSVDGDSTVLNAITGTIGIAHFVAPNVGFLVEWFIEYSTLTPPGSLFFETTATGIEIGLLIVL